MTFILLILLFSAGVLGVGAILVRKIPIVLETPREVVNDYFDQSSSRIYVRVLRVGKWLRRGAFWDQILAFVLRVLRVTRIVLLKIDSLLFNLSKGVGARYEERKALELLEEKKENLPIQWEDLKSSTGPIVRDIEKRGQRSNLLET